MEGFGLAGRNDPCPCGSGRKYKQCCLPREQAFVTVRQAGQEFAQVALATLNTPELKPALEAGWRRYWPGPPPIPTFEEAVAAIDRPGVSENGSDTLAFLDWMMHDAPLEGLGPDLAQRGPNGGPPTLPDLLGTDIEVSADTVAGILVQGWRHSIATVAQVVRLWPGRTVWLRDAFTDETFEIWDRSLSQSATIGDLMVLRLRPLGEVYEAVGAGWSLPASGLRQLRAWGEFQLQRLREFEPEADWRRLFRARGELLHHYVVEQRDRGAAPPELYTTTGEPLVFCRAVWPVSDPDAVARALGRAPDLEPDREPGRWTWQARATDTEWFPPPDDADAAEGPPAQPIAPRTILANLVLDAETAELRLECMSERRLAAAVARIEALGGRHLGPAQTEVESLAQALARHQDDDTGDAAAAPEEIPDEAMAAALLQYIEESERRWINEPIPALGGKTPRQAAASADPAVRRSLTDLLLEIENAEARYRPLSPSGAGMSAERLRRLLGR